MTRTVTLAAMAAMERRSRGMKVQPQRGDIACTGYTSGCRANNETALAKRRRSPLPWIGTCQKDASTLKQFDTCRP